MTFVLEEPRVLVCGSRAWPQPAVVHTALDRLLKRYGDWLVVIEGRTTGADTAAHDWCEQHQLGPDRHRCYPVDWAAERRQRPKTWRAAGPERNTRMLLAERPWLIVAFHDWFDPRSGGTSDMCIKGLLAGVPVWLVPGPRLAEGRWLRLELFPPGRVEGARQALAAWQPTSCSDHQIVR
jgi:YspA, cpYpsA-related SLOG family